MNIDASNMSLALGVLNVIALVVGWVRLSQSGATRFARLELKTETMWDILVRDALGEAQKQGMLKRKSPAMLNGGVARAFADLLPRLREFYARNRLDKVSENELILMIARAYNDELLERVAMPLGINLRMALLAAVHLLKERPVDEEEEE